MRIAAVTITVIGILLACYVTIAAALNSAKSPYPFPIAFVAVTMVFASAGVIAAALTWRARRVGAWILIAAGFAGLLVWPWFAVGIVFLVAAVPSFVSRSGIRQVRPAQT